MKRVATARVVASSLAFLCALSATAAQAQTETPPELKYDRKIRDHLLRREEGVCPLNMVRVVDARPNKETIGESYKGAVLSPDINQWVTNGMLDLTSYGEPINLVTEDTVPGDGLLLKTAVTRSYLWTVGGKMFSMLVLKVQIIGKNGLVEDKTYRAYGDKALETSIEGDAGSTLNYALNNLLPVMAQDMAALCNGEQVDHYSYAGSEYLPPRKKPEEPK